MLKCLMFLDKCLVPRSKFLSSTREKAWSFYHKEYIRNMASVTKLTGSPAASAWLCLKAFQHLVSVNYTAPVTTTTKSLKRPMTEDDEDIVSYIGGSIVQKIKKTLFVLKESVEKSERLACLEKMREKDCDQSTTNSKVTLTGTLDRGGLVYLKPSAISFFSLVEEKFRDLCSGANESQYTENHFEHSCSQDENLTSKFLDIVQTGDSVTSAGEAVFSSSVKTYFRVRVHHECRKFMDAYRHRQSLSKREKSLRKTLKTQTSH